MNEKKSLILMVEDEEQVLNTNCRMLRRRGYDVRTAQTAAEACHQLEEHLPDLLILDIMLPDGNGLDICRRFREKTMNPVLFLTGKSDIRDRVEGLQQGGDYYLTKPYNFDEFLAVIQMLLERQKRMEKKIKEKFGVPQTGDMLLTSVGTIGIPYIIKKKDCFYFKDGNLTWFRDFRESLNSKYLYYWIKSSEGTGILYNTTIGSSQKALTISALKNIKVSLPPRSVQDKIVEVVSAYDDLIENNQKQIKLLEEAAQRLYKEWFVDLRFPGHENTKIVDGVPEGWSVYPFSSKVDIMSGGTPKTSIPDYYNGKIPFYTPKDSDGAFFAYKTQMNITEGGLKNCNSRLYPPKTVIITARGTVGKTTILAVPMAMNQSCYALKMKENDAPYYLFFALNNEIKALQTMANGGVFNTIIGKLFFTKA